MKPLNTIVADLEYCREIKELGVKQESLFYYSKPYDIHSYDVFKTIQTGSSFPPISAWTASELFEMLPHDKLVYYADEQYKCSIWKYEVQVGKTPEEAMARMLIYLLKNNIISLEEVNKNI